jgi:hypothetical protein
MRALSILLVLFSLFRVLPAAAESRNGYGQKGRTVLSGGLAGFVHGSGFTQSHDAWRVSVHATAVHFVQNNIAFGGTLLFDVGRFRDTGFPDDPLGIWGGGDLDFIGHVPLSRVLSLRFWGWVGVRQQKRAVLSSDPFATRGPLGTQKLLHCAFGTSPQLLLHLSSSVGVAFGPSFSVYAPLSASALWDWSFDLGSSLTYSFGSPPRDEDTGAPVVPRFAARGRNVLLGGVGFSSGGMLSYARFVTDHFALGPRVFAGGRDGHGERNPCGPAEACTP